MHILPQNYIRQIFDRLAQHINEPTTELQYTNNYTLLVAVILSAQATDVGVNKATKDLFYVVKSPQDMMSLGEKRLKDYIKTIGLFNSKAKNVIGMSSMLIERFNSQIPDNLEDLVSLPGVGRKTANVILNTAFGQSTIAVDTHIFRLANRLKIAPGKTPLEVEQNLLKVVPQEYLKDAHHLLILHGRYTCVARKPKCHNCVLYNICQSDDRVYSE